MKTCFLTRNQEATMDGSAQRTTARHASVVTAPQQAGADQAPATSSRLNFITIRRTATYDDAWPTFAEMTRRPAPAASQN